MMSFSTIPRELISEIISYLSFEDTISFLEIKDIREKLSVKFIKEDLHRKLFIETVETRNRAGILEYITYCGQGDEAKHEIISFMKKYSNNDVVIEIIAEAEEDARGTHQILNIGGILLDSALEWDGKNTIENEIEPGLSIIFRCYLRDIVKNLNPPAIIADIMWIHNKTQYETSVLLEEYMDGIEKILKLDYPDN